MLFFQASWSRVWLIWAWKMHDSWPLPSPENQCTEFWWPRQLRLDNETPLRAIYNLKAHPDQVATMQWCMMGTVIAIDEYSKAGCPSPSPWRRPPGWSVTLSLLECVALDEDGGRRRMERTAPISKWVASLHIVHSCSFGAPEQLPLWFSLQWVVTRHDLWAGGGGSHIYKR